MPNVNIITTSLPEYVDQNRLPLIREVAVEGVVLDHLTLQTGVKSKAALNYFKVDTFLQDGSACGFNALDTMDLTQRQIEVAMIKVNGEICPKTLLAKWAEYEVRTSAVDEAERMPFEEFVAEAVVADVKAKRDLAIWLGDTTIEPTDSETYAKSRFNGFVKLAQTETSTVAVAIPAGTTAFAALKLVAAALPAKHRKNSKIFVSPEFFFAFVMELVEKNFYHYSGPADEAPTELVFPGTNLRVIQQDALAGSLYIYASQTENMFYGTDLEDDVEEIKIWFSNDADVWRYKVQFTAGVQVAFPDRVVLGTLAANPDATGGASVAESLAQIVVNTGSEGPIVEALGDIETAIAGDADSLAQIVVNTGSEGPIVEALGDIETAIAGDADSNSETVGE